MPYLSAFTHRRPALPGISVIFLFTEVTGSRSRFHNSSDGRF
jgi:hypothetical protein